MKTHLLCMGPGYWLITKASKIIVGEDQFESCTKQQLDLFMCDMRTREAILSTLPKNNYNQVKTKISTNKLLEVLEAIHEGDKHSKGVKL